MTINHVEYVRPAREELAAILGVSARTVACTGKALAISEQNLNYLAPLKVLPPYSPKIKRNKKKVV